TSTAALMSDRTSTSSYSSMTSSLFSPLFVAFCSQSTSSFFTTTTPSEIYTLSLHDALPICRMLCGQRALRKKRRNSCPAFEERRDRKSTRLNSSHVSMSYAVFCLKKKRH